MGSALEQNADSLLRSRNIESGDPLVPSRRLFVNMHINLLHFREGCHFDATAPTSLHAPRIQLYAATFVIFHPVLKRHTPNFQVWILGDEVRDLTTQVVSRRSVPEAVR